MRNTIEYAIDAPAGERERLAAELHSLGTLGLWEVESGLRAYFDAAAPPAPVLALADAARGVSVAGPLAVPVQDWEAGWRHGLEPRRIGALWVRPSWCALQGEPELVIDPQQAFGSGEHATTRLALELLLGALRPGDRVLDVGTGSGILGLAALRCGAGAALGIDFDADACACARENAAHNALPLVLCRAAPQALRGGPRFELAVANLLAAELATCLLELADLAARDLVISGYLAPEAERWRAPLEARGWQLCAQRQEAAGPELWTASHWSRGRSRQFSSRDASVEASG